MICGRVLPGILLVFFLGFAEQAWGIRCGNHLVNKGDAVTRAARYCPQAFWIERWTAPGAGYGKRGLPPAGNNQGSFGLITRKVYASDAYEAWYINFGPRKLMRRLVFRNGYLDRETTLGYGFNRLSNKKCKARDLERAGHTLVEIYLKCGPPNYDYSFPLNIYPKYPDPRNGHNGVFTIYRHVWTYELSGQLDRELHFEDGRLIQITRLRD